MNSTELKKHIQNLPDGMRVLGINIVDGRLYVSGTLDGKTILYCNGAKMYD